LSDRLKKDGKYGRSSFVQALKDYGVFNEWRLRKGILPPSSINRIYLTESFKECLAYTGSLNRFTGYFDAIKNRSCAVEISVLVMFELSIKKTTEEEQKSMAKPMSYILNKEIVKDLFECQKLRDFMTENQLATLYGCQSLVHELNHPNRLLMTIFHELYQEDVVEANTWEDWVNDDEDVCEGKKKALFSVTAWLKAIRGFPTI